MAMSDSAINLRDKLSGIRDMWSPRVIAELNDYQSKLAKLRGEFVWHDHPDTDEAFLVLDGELTIRGVTNPVTLDLEYHGVATDPWGNEKALFSATTKIEREMWGLTWNAPLEAGGWLVGKTVDIELEIQAARAT